MSTVINNPGNTSDESSGVGVIVGVILAIVLGGLFLFYLLPMMTNPATPTPEATQIDVNLPNTPPNTTTPAPATEL